MLDVSEIEKEFAVLKKAELVGIRPNKNMRRRSSNNLLSIYTPEVTPRVWDKFEETKSSITLIVDSMYTTSENQRQAQHNKLEIEI